MGSLWLSLSMMAALAAEPARAPVPEGMPLTLALRFADPDVMLPFPLEAVEAEVQRLFAPLGVAVVEPGSAQSTVMVVMLSSDRSRGGLSPEVMGAVARDPQAPLVAWIMMPNVRRSLGGTRQQWPGLPAPLMARAVGRVLAHELIHLIAPDLPHAGSGLMRASLGRALLLDRDVAFDRKLGPTVRQRLTTVGRFRRPPIA